ncbi:MAG: polysaccharide biosynthesis C-terminal domain-containing protein, partial [Clostridia bacterium]|nr:polysaccharide biosynthesis C-terminal domain-containing protein [Clostridia bacterium]
EVLDGAALYMKIIFMGVPASLTYNFGASILRAIGDTKRPLYILSASGIINVILNLILVIGINMGVAGVAIATAVSNYISMIAVIRVLSKTDGDYRLNIKEMAFYKKELVEILSIGVPAGIQSSFFSLSNTVLQSSVNSYGETAIAGNAAAGNIEGFAYVVMNAFYQSTVTGVSQNFGAKDEKRINKTIWINLICVITAGLVVGGICVLLSRPLLGFYITDSAEAIKYGASRMLITCLPYFLCGVMEVLTGSLRGLGYSTITAVSSFAGTCIFRVIWAKFIVDILGGGVEILYLCWPISWALVSMFHAITLWIVKPRAMKEMLGY